MVFYEPGKTAHLLPKDPFKACVVPRPIGWISTLNEDGTANLAPFSHFNVCSAEDPPFVMFSASQKAGGGKKDSTLNAERTGEFCWSLTTYDLREHMNASAEPVPYGTDEFDLTGLTKAAGSVVCAPRVAESPVAFECRYHSTLTLPGNESDEGAYVVIGQVVGVHISEDVLTDGMIDMRKTRPIARVGYGGYAVLDESFEMIIPGTRGRPSSLPAAVAPVDGPTPSGP